MLKIFLTLVLLVCGVSYAEEKPIDDKASKTVVRIPSEKGLVWHSTKSKVYHFEGSKYYGTTKDGEFMKEADAILKGYTAAKNEKK